MDPTLLGRWQDAVDLGAAGQAAAARRRLDAIESSAETPAALGSLALSTRGSLTRQAGGHAVARRADGAAARRLAGFDVQSDPWTAAAWADALIGLAADDLGVGDLGASSILLDRASEHLAGLDDDAGDWRTLPRVRLRLAWVRTERRLYGRDPDGAAAAYAGALEAAAQVPSPRHRVKTDLIGAAVDAARGRTEEACRAAHDVYRRTGELGLAPLQWAAGTLLAALAPEPTEYIARVADLRRSLAVQGMPIAPLSPGERHHR